MDLDLDINLNEINNKIKENEINNKIKENEFKFYKCNNCSYVFYSKLKIINEEKFCGTDCRSSWYIRKYVNNNTKCSEVLSKKFIK
jgi:hypothetical protein